jgi:hypothetical protein
VFKSTVKFCESIPVVYIESPRSLLFMDLAGFKLESTITTLTVR